MSRRLQDYGGQAGGSKTSKSKHVFVAMSGGVDSSVAALLLKKEGYDVTGVFMRCYNLDGCAERDAEDARRVAGHLGIPFYVWDFEKEYKRRVVEYMVAGYKKGITPNPDVMCNREIKFGLFLKRALSLGAHFVATGHYVKIQSANVKGQKTYKLFQAKDKNKDQSYFLWTLEQEQLRHCLFPIGDYTKPQVRAIARRAGLPTAAKKDSQGICFLGKFSLKDFLKQRIPSRRGEVLTSDGVSVGTHDGAAFYTIGQRHLGIASSEWHGASSKGKNPQPFYVAEKDMGRNALIVAEGDDNPSLYKKELVLTDVNFSYSNVLKNMRIEVLARVRYRQPLARAILVISNSDYRLLFSSPIKFVAPGQSAVFYSKRGEMLGGGVIGATN